MTSSLIQNISSSSAVAAQTASRLGQTALTLYNASLLPLEIFCRTYIGGAHRRASITLIIKTGWFSVRVDRVRDVILKTDMPKKRASAAWAEVQKHFFAGNTNDLKIAVVASRQCLK